MKLQLLLHPHRRNPEGIASVRRISALLGLKPTAEGKATISADAAPETLQSLMGRDEARLTQGKAQAENIDLPVPDALRDYVQSITVPMPHTYFDADDES